MLRCPGRPLRWVLALLTLSLTLAAATRSAPAALGVNRFTYAVSMRDGTRLITDVYLPRIPKQSVPVILIRTPYGRDQIPRRAALLVCRPGRGLVVQDMRRGIPTDNGPQLQYAGWAAESRDGHDTLRWIAAQPWCDGNIGTWGPSALGITQNLSAPNAPSALKAQHIMFAASNMYMQVAYQGGAFRKALLESWLEQFQFEENLTIYREHYKYDQFWSMVNAEEKAHQVNAPAVFVGGWYDAFLQGTINSFVTIQNQGGPRARGNCRLIVGPWIHDEAERLARPRNIRRMPQAADPFRFFDYWLRCMSNGVPCDRPVHYYVMGAHCKPDAPGNYWRSAETWPPPAMPLPLYFHPDGSLTHDPPTTEAGRLSYQYDPCDPVPTVGGQNIFITRGPKDQRSVESRPDVLTFTSDPLQHPLEVTGRLLSTLHISSDCPDTDFTVKLTDVYPDGRSILLADGILRARFRESFEQEAFLEPDQVYQLTIDLWSTSYIFNRGHRIRVAVSSSNAPRFEPNPNTGAPRLQDGPPRVATNTLHLCEDYPSHILLPIFSSSH